MTSTLDYRDGHLCVLNEWEPGPKGEPNTLREWYPVRRASEVEVAILTGRPLTCVDAGEGLYVDEEGNPYQLLEGGRTRPRAVETTTVENGDEGKRSGADHRAGNGEAPAATRAPEDASTAGIAGEVRPKKLLRKLRGKRQTLAGSKSDGQSAQKPVLGKPPSDSAWGHLNDGTRAEDSSVVALNLRQKLAEVRRRIGYIQKRGHNERHNYSYVTAADLAGAVGDILAELGVVVIPQLQSISTETPRSTSERIARIVMNYRFVDAKSGEELTVRVAGEGADAGDKAPYKAMTGALKYALLQSFLLATGDDPEDERADSRSAAGPERVITPEQARELQRLIEETGTELERVLAYYRISALGEMTEASYRRALELLNRKLAKQSQENGAHAQN